MESFFFFLLLLLSGRGFLTIKLFLQVFTKELTDLFTCVKVSDLQLKSYTSMQKKVLWLVAAGDGPVPSFCISFCNHLRFHSMHILKSCRSENTSPFRC